MGFEIRGTKENPYHLSVAAVLLNEQGKVAVIRTPRGYHCLPRETIYVGESLIEGVQRGLREELGVSCTVDRFLGSIVNHFNLPDGTDIVKTTLYFEAHVTDLQGDRSPEIEEADDEVVWLDTEPAIEKIKESRHREGGRNEEYLIVSRAVE